MTELSTLALTTYASHPPRISFCSCRAGGRTANELARELDVSVGRSTATSEELSVAGVPIFAERGRWVLGWRRDRTSLTGMTPRSERCSFRSYRKGGELGTRASVPPPPLEWGGGR